MDTQPLKLVIGLMSGTSMDGVDVALLQTDGINRIKTLASDELCYPSEFYHLMKAAEYGANQCQGDMLVVENDYLSFLELYLARKLLLPEEAISEKINRLTLFLNDELMAYTLYRQYETHRTSSHPLDTLSLINVIRLSTFYHIQAIQQCLTTQHVDIKTVHLIGYHGQTLYHNPPHACTIQVGYAEVLAKALQTSTVHQFRLADVKAGGEGAPFAPIYHLALTRQAITKSHMAYPVVIVNCGGIANVTIIKNPDPEQLLGFDTGPGNALLDRFVNLKTSGKENMDYDGQYAKQGKFCQQAFDALYERSCQLNNENFYLKPAPKSLDINSFELPEEVLSMPLEDGCATLSAFTIMMIIKALKHQGISTVQHFILAGGGWHNPCLKNYFQQLAEENFRPKSIQHANEIGWDGNALEAEIFAYLAVRHQLQLPLSYPCTTGVPSPTTGGELIAIASKEISSKAD